MDDCSPGRHSHSDQPNFRLEDYLEMCRSGEAKFTYSECAKVMGVTRAWIYRAIELTKVSEEELDDIVDHCLAKGRKSETAIVDEIKRRTGKAKNYVERCPNCNFVLRERFR